MGVAGADVSLFIRVKEDDIRLGKCPAGDSQLTFTVSHRQVHSIDSFGEDAWIWLIHPQMHPAALEFAGIIACESYYLRAVFSQLGQKTGFHQHLKAITNA